MRFTKLLVLGVLALMGVDANAADLVERTAPEKPSTAAALEAGSFESLDKTPAPLAPGQAYVMYNVAAGKCYLAGHSGTDWNTRAYIGASASTDGDTQEYVAAVMYFAQTDAALTKGEGIYELKSWVPKFSEFRSSFDDGSNIWTDNNGHADRFWKVEATGADNKYRISNATVSEGKVMGWNGSEDDLRVYMLDPTADGAAVDWQFFTVADWTNYLVSLDAYEVSSALKAAIGEAEAAGIDVAAAVAVYNNLSASAADIKAATEKLNEAIAGNVANGTPDNPTNASSFITNATFDTIGDFHGWSGTAFGAGGTTSTNAEWYQAAKDANAYQDLSGLAPGVYLAGVKGFYRAGQTDDSYKHFKAQDSSTKNVQFYVTANGQTYETNVNNNFVGAPAVNPGVSGQTSATDSETGVIYYVPNTMASAEYYMHTLGLYDNFLFVEVGADKAMRIGVKKTGDMLTGDWAIFDDFSLLYFGNEAASLPKAYEKAFTLKNTIKVAEGTAVTQQYVDAYEAAVKAAATKAVATTADAQAALEASYDDVDAAAAALRKNLSLWGEWEQAILDGQKVKGEGNDELDEYIEYDVPEIRADGYKLTNEEIEKDIAQVKAWIEMGNMEIAPGTDVTLRFLKNADCEKTDGWQGGPVTGSGGGNTCFEKYAVSNFDVYQIVTKAPKGVYSIEVQGFYRRMRPESGSYTMYQNGEQNPCGYVYMNTNATGLKCVYDDPNEEKYSQGNDAQTNAEGVEMYYPNDMTSAAEAFAAGKYKSKAYGLILNDGDELRIGVKGSEGGSDWAIWDNFKLVYEGYAADVVKPVLEESIAAAKENLKLNFAKDLKETLTNAIAEGEKAAAGTDGDAMFQALSAIMNISVDASVEKYKTLQTRNEDLAAATAAATLCELSTIADAQALNAEITDGLDTGAYSDSDIDAKTAEIAAMIKRLGIPAGMNNATDADPMDVSTIIINNSYDNGNNTGWTLNATPGFSSGLIEVYNANFDEYQELEFLPAGTYEVTVQGFYRFGDGVRDDSTYVQNPEANNNLLLYVTVGEETITQTMPRLAKDGKELHTSYLKSDDGKSFVAGDDIENSGDRWQWMWLGTPEADADSTYATGYRLANGMVPVASRFEAGKFGGTSIIFKVGEDGKARIGLKKEIQENANWCIWDNWKLTYYGPASTKEPTVSGIANAAAAAAKTEFFGLNGARVARPGKGVTIVKQTLSDGSVKISKVIVK